MPPNIARYVQAPAQLQPVGGDLEAVAGRTLSKLILLYFIAKGKREFHNPVGAFSGKADFKYEKNGHLFNNWNDIMANRVIY